MAIRHQIYDRWAGGRIAVLGNLCRRGMTSQVLKVGIVGFPSQTTANQVLLLAKSGLPELLKKVLGIAGRSVWKGVMDYMCRQGPGRTRSFVSTGCA